MESENKKPTAQEKRSFLNRNSVEETKNLGFRTPNQFRQNSFKKTFNASIRNLGGRK